jgi:hypothetical protein
MRLKNKGMPVPEKERGLESRWSPVSDGESVAKDRERVHFQGIQILRSFDGTPISKNAAGPDT